MSLPLAQRDAAAADYDADGDVAGRRQVAIEQFDASATRPLLGFGEGWHEQEFNPRTGARWRWLSERGELLIACRRRPRRSLILHLEGESPRTYFPRGSRLVVRRRSRLFDEVLSSGLLAGHPIGGARQSVRARNGSDLHTGRSQPAHSAIGGISACGSSELN